MAASSINNKLTPLSVDEQEVINDFENNTNKGISLKNDCIATHYALCRKLPPLNDTHSKKNTSTKKLKK